MGHHLDRYLKKQANQKAAKKENQLYYQNGKEWSYGRPEAERAKHRREAGYA